MAHRWGMAVDLDRCTGCEACVTACHAENNIPTVGPGQAQRGRAMHWIRVERYWEGDFPDVRLKFRPVMCQHCDAAPCEPVCPTYASHHLKDGQGKTGCAQECPSKALVFGDLNGPDSEVSRLSRSPRGSKLLDDLGTRPKVTYLQRQSAV